MSGDSRSVYHVQLTPKRRSAEQRSVSPFSTLNSPVPSHLLVSTATTQPLLSEAPRQSSPVIAAGTRTEVTARTIVQIDGTKSRDGRGRVVATAGLHLAPGLQAPDGFAVHDVQLTVSSTAGDPDAPCHFDVAAAQPHMPSPLEVQLPQRIAPPSGQQLPSPIEVVAEGDPRSGSERVEIGLSRIDPQGHSESPHSLGNDDATTSDEFLHPVRRKRDSATTVAGSSSAPHDDDVGKDSDLVRQVNPRCNDGDDSDDSPIAGGFLKRNVFNEPSTAHAPSPDEGLEDHMRSPSICVTPECLPQRSLHTPPATESLSTHGPDPRSATKRGSSHISDYNPAVAQSGRTFSVGSTATSAAGRMLVLPQESPFGFRQRASPRKRPTSDLPPHVGASPVGGSMDPHELAEESGASSTKARPYVHFGGRVSILHPASAPASKANFPSSIMESHADDGVDPVAAHSAPPQISADSQGNRLQTVYARDGSQVPSVVHAAPQKYSIVPDGQVKSRSKNLMTAAPAHPVDDDAERVAVPESVACVDYGDQHWSVVKPLGWVALPASLGDEQRSNVTPSRGGAGGGPAFTTSSIGFNGSSAFSSPFLARTPMSNLPDKVVGEKGLRDTSVDVSGSKQSPLFFFTTQERSRHEQQVEELQRNRPASLSTSDEPNQGVPETNGRKDVGCTSGAEGMRLPIYPVTTGASGVLSIDVTVADEFQRRGGATAGTVAGDPSARPEGAPLPYVTEVSAGPEEVAVAPISRRSTSSASNARPSVEHTSDSVVGPKRLFGLPPTPPSRSAGSTSTSADEAVAARSTSPRPNAEQASADGYERLRAAAPAAANPVGGSGSTLISISTPAVQSIGDTPAPASRNGRSQAHQAVQETASLEFRPPPVEISEEPPSEQQAAWQRVVKQFLARREVSTLQQCWRKWNRALLCSVIKTYHPRVAGAQLTRSPPPGTAEAAGVRHLESLGGTPETAVVTIRDSQGKGVMRSEADSVNRHGSHSLQRAHHRHRARTISADGSSGDTHHDRHRSSLMEPRRYVSAPPPRRSSPHRSSHRVVASSVKRTPCEPQPFLKQRVQIFSACHPSPATDGVTTCLAARSDGIDHMRGTEIEVERTYVNWWLHPALSAPGGEGNSRRQGSRGRSRDTSASRRDSRYQRKLQHILSQLSDDLQQRVRNVLSSSEATTDLSSSDVSSYHVTTRNRYATSDRCKPRGVDEERELLQRWMLFPKTQRSLEKLRQRAMRSPSRAQTLSTQTPPLLELRVALNSERGAVGDVGGAAPCESPEMYGGNSEPLHERGHRRTATPQDPSARTRAPGESHCAVTLATRRGVVLAPKASPDIPSGDRDGWQKSDAESKRWDGCNEIHSIDAPLPQVAAASHTGSSPEDRVTAGTRRPGRGSDSQLREPTHCGRHGNPSDEASAVDSEGLKACSRHSRGRGGGRSLTRGHPVSIASVTRQDGEQTKPRRSPESRGSCPGNLGSESECVVCPPCRTPLQIGQFYCVAHGRLVPVRDPTSAKYIRSDGGRQEIFAVVRSAGPSPGRPLRCSSAAWWHRSPNSAWRRSPSLGNRKPSGRLPLTEPKSPLGPPRVNPYCAVCVEKYNLVLVDEFMNCLPIQRRGVSPQSLTNVCGPSRMGNPIQLVPNLRTVPRVGSSDCITQCHVTTSPRGEEESTLPPRPASWEEPEISNRRRGSAPAGCSIPSFSNPVARAARDKSPVTRSRDILATEANHPKGSLRHPVQGHNQIIPVEPLVSSTHARIISPVAASDSVVRTKSPFHERGASNTIPKSSFVGDGAWIATERMNEILSLLHQLSQLYEPGDAERNTANRNALLHSTSGVERKNREDTSAAAQGRRTSLGKLTKQMMLGPHVVQHGSPEQRSDTRRQTPRSGCGAVATEKQVTQGGHGAADVAEVSLLKRIAEIRERDLLRYVKKLLKHGQRKPLPVPGTGPAESATDYAT